MRFLSRRLCAVAAFYAAIGLPAVGMAGTQYQYDALSRLTRVAYDNGVVIQYSYDAAGNRSQVISTVPVPNRSPVALADSASVATSAAVDIFVRANDSDPDGDPLTITSLSAVSGGGTAVIQGGGTHVRYTAPSAPGTKTFTYTISDGRGANATATVTINVTQANRAPVAVNDSASVKSSMTVDIMARANDTDADGDPITITSVSAVSGGGTATIQGGGTHIRYAAPTTGGSKTFTYAIADGRGGTASANVTVAVAANTPPIAGNDSASVNASASIDIMVRANDSDPDGDALTIVSVGTPSGGGTTTIMGGGDYIRFTASTAGGTKTFGYNVSDGRGGTATGIVSVNVIAPNRPPVAVNDYREYLTYQTEYIDVVGNDSDPDGDTLTVTSVGPVAGNGTVSIAPGGGSVIFNTGGLGTKTFPYTISDGRGGTATATVTVVTHRNFPESVLSNQAQGSASESVPPAQSETPKK